MLIIRRINCINTTSGICHSMSVTFSWAGRKGTLRLAHETVTDTLTYTRCCIDTTDSPDDEHEVARKILRLEINT